MTTDIPRLPAVRPLSKILPGGTEGGKEFGRIVGLLLFQEAQRSEREFTLFDDASGDYEGLDSFSRRPRTDKAIGYQYKFFPSPLSDAHRLEIRNSIDHAIARSKKLTLEKYVLVTPDDLKNSAKRREGGDVEWFENLRKQYVRNFELEHFGHSKLQSLFTQSHHLCLYYYPALVTTGVLKRKTIQEFRVQYDRALKARFGRIEFVGMSVYKEEASRRIPLEQIYIPLSVVSEKSPDEDENTIRTDPTSFLSQGSKTVILGDPGSGKSTLLAFLALVGISTSLQTRCDVSADNRLTVVVTLRRYADELKEGRSVSLLEHITDTIRADFNVDGIDKDFLEFYLLTGQAIILFDGIDELPGTGYKKTIRQRIEAFNALYPSNTIVITSRIIGYDAETRFNEAFSHFRVAKLRTPEIERFIKDWYAARIGDVLEQRVNSSDLVKVITNPDNESIRDLARNPLLLTIVALVHRIDAVLPDQRVVLYQKCTETLLNTWYRAKKRDEEVIKGRIERRNRLRVESIAYWMHRRSLEEKGRAVAPHADILAFLTSHISDKEIVPTDGEPPEDQAERFLNFIKNTAGLLIEAGDGLYSFIHLTFQEYLSATHLTTFGEMGGTQAIWDELGGDLNNPRWREVVRLLVASLRSTSGQEFFVKKLLNPDVCRETRDAALLLIGLLRDGVEPAEEEALEITTHALKTLFRLDNSNDVRAVHSALAAWFGKDKKNEQVGTHAVKKLFASSDPARRLTLLLTKSIVHIDDPMIDERILIYKNLAGSLELSAFARLVDREVNDTIPTIDWSRMNSVHDFWATESPEGNVAAAAGLCISILLDPIGVPRRLFHRELVVLGAVPSNGPHNDHMLNLLSFALPLVVFPPEIAGAFKIALGSARGQKARSEKETSLIVSRVQRLLAGKRTPVRNKDTEPSLDVKNTLLEKANLASSEVTRLPEQLRHFREPTNTSGLGLIKKTFRATFEKNSFGYIKMIFDSEIYSELLFPSLQLSLNVSPVAHWQEALRGPLQSRVSEAICMYFDIREWETLITRFKENTQCEDDRFFAAWLVMLDIWTWEHEGYHEDTSSPLKRIISVVQGDPHPLLRFVLSLRKACLQLPGANEELTALVTDRESGLADLLTDVGWAHPGPVNRRPKTHMTANTSV